MPKMNKHLPGRHNQKTHGSNKHSGPIDPIVLTHRLGGHEPWREAFIDWTFEAPDSLQLSRVLHFKNNDNDMNYQRHLFTKLVDLEARADAGGIKHIKTTTISLRPELAAKMDYHLTTPFNSAGPAVSLNALNYLSREYDLNYRVEDVFEIATKIKPNMMLADFLNIRHPRHPNLRVFYEYVTSDNLMVSLIKDLK